MRSILVDVDTQKDFMLPDGKLYVPGAQNIIPSIRKVFRTAVRSATPIISTVDWHLPNDQEFKTFPPHCVAFSEGAEKIPETLAYLPAYELMWYEQEAKPIDGFMHHIVTKKTYDIWDPVNGNPIVMNHLIKTFAPNNIFLMGIATDICVLAASKGLKDAILWLVYDAIKGLDKEQSAIEEMSDRFIPISSEDVEKVM